MTPELWDRLKPLYEAFLETPPDKRAQFAAQACGDDRELKRELEALLAVKAEGTSTLDAPLVDFNHLNHPVRNQAFRDDDLLLGRFRIVRLLGFGGMGEVYDAEDGYLSGVHVALKTILPHIAEDPDLQKRFEREVVLAREVVHPNLCPIYDIFHCDVPPPGLLFLTMKLLPGSTLAERLRRGDPMPLEDRLAILSQAASGQVAMHSAGIVHRDIKPSNFIVDGTGANLRLWITDFGVARACQNEPTLSNRGSLAGTPGYLAPELLQGHPPSAASDLFAFGIVMHEVFAGTKPLLAPDGRSYAVSPRLSESNVPSFCVELVTECLSHDPKRRCVAFEKALKIIDPKLAQGRYTAQTSPVWTRRRFVGAGAAGLCMVSAGAWWKQNELEYLFEPIPAKRSVALMAWPDGELSSVVSTILDSIGQRLARAEAYIKDLLIVTSKDLPEQAASPATPAELLTSLGANLVLAASLKTTPSQYLLTLQVLDAATQRVLRKARVFSVPAELSSLPDKASQAAAEILGLPMTDQSLKDTEELRRASPEVFRTFSEAEQLASEPNDSRLEAAILKYQQALDLDPHFALGYARLAMTYTEQYLAYHEEATLNLAQSNARLAIRYNPGSAKALLSQAVVLLYSGKLEEAFAYFVKALKADPGNPQILLYKAQALRNSGQWPQAERVYRDIIADRPNYWFAHNELGWLLSRRADYKGAAQEFELAATAAPRVALPLANLATIYMEQTQPDKAKAIDACNRSLQRGPNDVAYLLLGDIAFSERDYRKSLDYYQLAAKLDPRDDLVWRNIGDCHAMMGHTSEVGKDYSKAAQLLADSLTTNPRSGPGWASLAFYHAKLGKAEEAKKDLKKATDQGAKDVKSQLMMAQALALLGEKEEALALLLSCIDQGLSPVEVDLALDLKSLRKDPRYLARVSKLQPKKPA